MSATLVFGLLALCLGNDAAPTRVQRMTISKMRMADLESSASGYVYNQQQGLPVSYVQYTNHGSGGYYDAPDTVHYVLGASAPVAPATAPRYAYATARHEIVPHAEQQSYGNEEIANYANDQLPKYVPPPGSINLQPRAPYYVPEKGSDVSQVEGNDTHQSDEEDDDEEYEDTEEDEGVDEDDSSDPKNDKGSTEESGNGEKYAAEQDEEYKEKGEKGYEKEKEFDEGDHGRHNNAKEQGYYDEEGSRKSGHVDTAKNYGSDEEAEEDEDGSSYGSTSYSKKGHKTNGFHNIYHKDDYKKVTDFYDDDHKEGHFEKYGEQEEHSKSAEGGFEKGGQKSSDFEHEDRGKKGYYDKGRHRNQVESREIEKGDSAHHKNHEKYSMEEDSKSVKSRKFDRDYSEH